MKLKLIILISFFSILTCCKSSKTDTNNKCKELIITKEEVEKEQGEVIITKASIIDKKILIDFTANGFNSHSNIELVWDGRMAKSLPPIAYLVLVMDKGTKESSSFKTCFDLTPMKETVPNSSVKIQIKGFKETLLLD